MEARDGGLIDELAELREWKRLAENDALIRRIREVCEKHCDDSLDEPPYTQIWRIEQCIDGCEGALDDWYEFFDFAANGEAPESVISRFEAWKAAKKNSPVAKQVAARRLDESTAPLAGPEGGAS